MEVLKLLAKREQLTGLVDKVNPFNFKLVTMVIEPCVSCAGLQEEGRKKSCKRKENN